MPMQKYKISFMKSIFYAHIFILLFTVQVFALSGKVVNVADGDTITVLSNNIETKVRLYGIDCPEKSQPYGQKAKQFVLSMVSGKQVDVDIIDTDRYGRAVGVIKLSGTILNTEIIKAGLAWQYERYCKMPFCSEWKQLESDAKAVKAGLWSEPNPEPPWDFRHENKNKPAKVKHFDNSSFQTESKESNPSNQTIESATGEFHGNSQSHKFHNSGCRHYDCSNCTVIFNSRDKAINSGYQPCKICNP